MNDIDVSASIHRLYRCLIRQCKDHAAQTTSLRQNNRFWGLYSADELDLSLHNDAYESIVVQDTRSLASFVKN